MKIIAQFIRDENGATAIEYGLLVGLLAVAIIVSVGSVGTSIVGIFDDIATKFDNF